MEKTKSKNTSEVKGSMKNKIYSVVLIAGIVLIAYALFAKNKGSEVVETKDDNQQQAEVKNENQNANIGDVVNSTGKKYLEGVLYNSDNPSRGNIKLSSTNTDIYIRTSRDFSSLIGLNVSVFINGTLDNFELVDIQPKLEKDGFIIQQ